MSVIGNKLYNNRIIKKIHNYRKQFRKATIFGRFIKYFAGLMLIPILTGSIISYYTQSNSSQKNAAQLYREINTRTNMNLSMMLQSIENAVNDIAFNSTIQASLDSYNKNKTRLSSTSVIGLKDILLDSSIKSSLLIENAIIFTKNGDYYTDLGFYNEQYSIKDYNFFNALLKSHGENMWIPSHIDSKDTMTGSQNVITLTKKILLDKGDDIGSTLGYLVVNVREKDVNKLLYAYVNQTENLELVSPVSGIVSSRNEQNIGKKFDLSLLKAHSSGSYFTNMNHKDSFVTFSKQDKTGWYLIGVVDSSMIFKESRSFFNTTIISAGIQFLIFIIISALLSKRISKPIVKLHKKIKKVEGGDFNVAFNGESGILEIDDLTMGFNDMVFKLNNLINEVYNAELKEKKLEVEVKKAELKALEQQINPHFLYNTLDCINWMASLEGNDNVSRMVTALGNYFRSTIHRGGNFITIEEEVNNIKEYLYIQSIRCGMRIKTEITLMPEAAQYLTMKLMLQPLVENAIVHGLEPQNGPGNLTINIAKEEKQILFVITDDGVGIAPEILKQLVGNKQYGKEQRIGVKNVQERLRLYFGEKHTFAIESTEGKGTEIKISIPCIYNEEDI